MKKIITLVLALIMTAAVLPLSSSALTHEQFSTVLTPFSTRGFTQSATDKMNEEILKLGAYPYYHYTAPAGSYSNSDQIFSFKPLDVAFSDYPYIKLCYKTNSPATSLDVSMKTPAGEKWMNSKPSTNTSDEWTSVIFNYNDIKGNDSVAFPSAGEKDITMRLKPFGSGNYTVPADAYFDICYVALFKTEAEAKAFNHNNTKIAVYDYDIITPEALYKKYIGPTNTDSVLYSRLSSNESFVRAVAAPGQYSNNLVINFTHDAFPLLSKPYVKVCYRTDSPAAKCDVSMKSENGENWLSGMPTQNTTGEWSTLIFNLNDLTGNDQAEAPAADSTSIIVRLKPWGAGNVDLKKETYYDIKYVGFFSTSEEASSFNYPGDTSYPFDFSLYTSSLDYSFASNNVVLDYIEDAEARSNEILYTNNTVPYENHLALSNVKGVYEGDYKDSSFKITPNGSAGRVSFTQNDVNFKDFPYIKIGYNTNSTSVSVAYKNTSDVQSSLSMTNGVMNVSGISDMKSLEIIPFGTDSVSSDKYFSIDYIGVFKSEAEANAYTCKGENADNMTKTHIIYTANLLDPASTATGNIYFVSSSTGSDSNPGTSPDKPLKTIAKLNFKTCVGTVYFKRGDTFRITSPLVTQHDSVYTSYGYGDKPIITGAIDGKGAEKWSATGTPNVWVFNQTITNWGENSSGQWGFLGDVGNIKINGGKLWGIKVCVHNKDDNRVDNGNVFNGRTYIEPLADVAVNGGLGLYNDLEYHHEYYSGKLYLYCADGNPGEVFDSIEIADKGHVANGTFNNTVIDNIHATGSGSHGFGYGNVYDSLVTNCYLEWIGGSVQTRDLSGNGTTNNPTRFGNAVESYGAAYNFTIANCFASNIYDCCWTVQNQSATEFINVEMYDNVAEYSNSGLEVWQNGGTNDHLYLHDNYTLYGGYGWSHQRPNKDGNFFYGGTLVRTTAFTNCSVENNVNILASSVGVLAAEIGSSRYNFNHNVYIMGENKTFTNAPLDTEHGTTTTNIQFNHASLNNVVSRGTENGSKFLYVLNDAFNIGDDPKEAFAISDNSITNVTLDTNILSIAVGEKHTVTASIVPTNPSNPTLIYSSQNPIIADIDQSGTITANSPGVAKITVSAVETGVSDSITVYVANNVTPSLWSKNAPAGDATVYNAYFIGDEFFVGNNSLAEALENDYYLNITKNVSDGMSIASENTVAENIDNSAESADIIFVSAGLNDYLAGVSIADFKAAFTDTVKQIRVNATYSNIVYVSPYFLNTAENAVGLDLSDYINAAKAVCDDEYVIFADMYTKSGTSFVLRSKDDNPGEINGNYLDYLYHTTAKGAECFANDLIKLLTDEASVNVYGLDALANRYSAYKIYQNLSFASGDHKFALGGLHGEGTKSYVNISVTGTANSTDNTYFQIDFKNSNINIKETPIIKIWYRTKVSQSGAAFDINAGVISGGVSTRIWASAASKPSSLLSYDKSGELTSMTIDASKYFISGENSASFTTVDEGSTLQYLRFKPYKSVPTQYTKDDYFEFESITFYATEEEAARDGMPLEEAEAVINYGDANDDGKIDIIDAIQMSRHVGAWNGYIGQINFLASDIDRDGYVAPDDYVTLVRYLAKWCEYANALDD